MLPILTAILLTAATGVGLTAVACRLTLAFMPRRDP